MKRYKLQTNKGKDDGLREAEELAMDGIHSHLQTHCTHTHTYVTVTKSAKTHGAAAVHTLTGSWLHPNTRSTDDASCERNRWDISLCAWVCAWACESDCPQTARAWVGGWVRAYVCAHDFVSSRESPCLNIDVVRVCLSARAQERGRER